MIRFENVSFIYPNGFCAVKDLSFSVQQGENIAVVGQNGAGKSTAAKLINGLLKPTDGKVTVAGEGYPPPFRRAAGEARGVYFPKPG